ncbi:hypothetical protein Francci3_3917 [Frankia casuarinae]|uniref:Uncharacterized protein n=1 Tax=Frankia casuarinae (strain DSM 45818 / CECT 9043 / HFP020203 / CcI3) TaxID=106370 RepID=Q2J625_FRACC|nr:hypothetical protein Francci3_3917 [Frankia casuarinae]
MTTAYVTVWNVPWDTGVPGAPGHGGWRQGIAAHVHARILTASHSDEAFPSSAAVHRSDARMTEKGLCRWSESNRHSSCF